MSRSVCETRHSSYCCQNTGAASGFRAVCGVVTASIPFWSVLFLSEAESVQDDQEAHPCQHSCYRRYPGSGSWAVVFVIRNSMAKAVRSCTWRGRCGAVHLRQQVSPLGTGFNIYIIGIHGAHGGSLPDTSADLSFLVRRRPYGSQILIMGDWYIDLLPTLSVDPWQERIDRQQHHAGQRVLLEAFAETHRLHVFVPQRWSSVPGGPFAEQCLMSPITRVPTGQSVAVVLPSTLDYGLGSQGFITDSFIHWEKVPADHALVGYKCTPVFVKREAAKTRWKCVDPQRLRRLDPGARSLCTPKPPSIS